MFLKLDGKQLSAEIEQRLKEEIQDGMRKVGRQPGLAVIRVGDDPASGVYVSNKEKSCSRVGVKSFGKHFSKDVSEKEVIETIWELNENSFVDGILVQLPLPRCFDQESILKAIDPDKDADGLHALNLGRLLKGEKGPRSCTPAGVMALLTKYGISVKGKKVVVIGRSILVGKPMALMLQSANATVTVAHSHTKDLVEITRQADLLVVAAGKPQLIGAEHIKKNSVVIDVGIHRLPSNPFDGSNSKPKLCGDVRSDELKSLVSAITPVPGGVGPMTVAMLLVNTVNRWQYHCGLSSSLDDLLP